MDTDIGWFKRKSEVDYICRRVLEGCPREMAQAEWDVSWAIADRYERIGCDD